MILPALNYGEIREVDRLMVEWYGITPIQTMENAGRNLALLAKRLLDDDLVDRPIVVLVGRGNKGGAGLVAARHLLNWGAWVQLLCSHLPEEYAGAAAHQLGILQAMDAPLAWAEEGWELPPCDLVIDAVVGYGLRGEPQGKARDLIHLANSSVAPILSLEIPSGINGDDGMLWMPHIGAAATLTLAMPKRALLAKAARMASGDLYLADISVPLGLYAQLGIEVPAFFSRDPIVRWDVVDGAAVLVA